MALPAVQWFNASNTTQVSTWDIGTVDAGSVSSDTVFYIWNNRGGSAAISDMINCTITTKDSSGGNTGEIITNKWIKVKVDSMNETTYTPIGGTDTKVIQAGASAGAGTIKGTANDGTVSNSVANYAKVSLHANVPTTATAGNFSFLTRVFYQAI
ncbi:hypothetical protein [Paenibacillus lutrae]|uniref:Uncharacterized protein n=1 Tax=Paenibacillus lutrae TaxID=2078573 RepID=A0A7X3FJ97_9BACL|nr:hypothetical protein [Paenibacillus lutrae]MVP00796.1 hypothetical protein [Paenibacillus lutrae]